VLICLRLFAQMDTSGTTDASLTVVDCADGTRGLAMTNAAARSATRECFSE
jgi:hypothetical protein